MNLLACNNAKLHSCQYFDACVFNYKDTFPPNMSLFPIERQSSSRNHPTCFLFPVISCPALVVIVQYIVRTLTV